MTSLPQTGRKKLKTITLWDDIKDDSYVSSIGGISVEWDQEFETKQYAKKLLRVNGMI